MFKIQQHAQHAMYSSQKFVYNVIRNHSVKLSRNLSTSTSNIPKLRIVMDLDECMVHTSGMVDRNNEIHIKHVSNIGAIFIDDFAVTERPGVHSFLDEISQFADIYAYTAGTEGYASHVFKHLDPHGKIFKKLLFRDSCVRTMDGQYRKDLKKFGDNVYIPERTVLIDNNPTSFVIQPKNGILIPDFFGHKEDEEKDTHLHTYALPILKQIVNVEDIRPILMGHMKIAIEKYR